MISFKECSGAFNRYTLFFTKIKTNAVTAKIKKHTAVS